MNGRHIAFNIGLFLICLGTSALILGIRGIIPAVWVAIITTIFGGAGLVFTLAAWLMPFQNIGPFGKGAITGYSLNSALLLAMIIVSLVIPNLPFTPLPLPHCTLNGGDKVSISPVANGIGVTRASDGECIGISDGSFAFLGRNTNNAETRIYNEDQQNADQPHITIVVATMLSGSSDSVGVGRDELQGAYVAQEEADRLCMLRQEDNCFFVRLLIANIGGNSMYASTVAQQIVQLKQHDKTFVGVMGLPFSAPAIDAIKILARQHIPVISPSASSDDLTNPSVLGDPSLVGYFRRVAPPDSQQGRVAALYADQLLKAKTVALFFDETNAYSRTLANSFMDAFSFAGNDHIVFLEQYRRGNKATIDGALDDTLKRQPNLIYFAGYADDLDTLLGSLSASGQDTNVKVMGGDALYELGGYSPPDFKHIYFTSFAYPDEWDFLGLSSSPQQPRLFAEYAQDFGPAPAGASPYGYTRADSGVILSYDALKVFLQACQSLLSKKKSVTTDSVHQELKKLPPLQGASGQITFAPDGNPVDKAVSMLCVDGYSRVHIVGMHGQFLVDGGIEMKRGLLSDCQ